MICFVESIPRCHSENPRKKLYRIQWSKVQKSRFSKISKNPPSKIEHLVEISMFFNEMVIRPTNKVQETHL